MNILEPEFYKLLLGQMVEADPLAEIKVSCLNQIILSPRISRNEKLRKIFEFNLPYSIIHYCLQELLEGGQIPVMDYTYMILQLGSWCA